MIILSARGQAKDVQDIFRKEYLSENLFIMITLLPTPLLIFLHSESCNPLTK